MRRSINLEFEQLMNNYLLKTILGFGFLSLLLVPNVVEADDDLYQFGIVGLKPYAYHDDEGKLQGSVPKYLHGLCHKLDLECKANIYPLRRLLDLLYSGQLDMALLPAGVYDESKVIASDQAVALLDVGFFSDKTNDFNPKQLNGVDLIVVRDYAYSGVLAGMQEKFEDLNVVYASSLDAAFKMLEYKRGDAVLAYNDYAINSVENIDELNYYPVYKAHIYPCYSKLFLENMSEKERKNFLNTHRKFAQDELKYKTHQKDHYKSIQN